jgi:hypothetical protein
MLNKRLKRLQQLLIEGSPVLPQSRRRERKMIFMLLSVDKGFNNIFID